MADVWNEARVQQYIDGGIEESQNLDYKVAGALAKTDGKRKDITKHVSAMANSDGGVIIYGISEDENNRHLPGKIDPISRAELSKEWLDNVVSSILPNIEGLVIHPVAVNGSVNKVVYVVEIPQPHTNTLHQATDKRYYKRVGFKSRPMDHYEIVERLNRKQHPQIDLDFEIIRIRSISSDMGVEHETEPQFRLVVHATNSGSVYARHTDIQIQIPPHLLDFNEHAIWDEPENDAKPMHPGRRYQVRNIPLRKHLDNLPLEDLYLKWIVSADNAPKSEGKAEFSTIKVIDRTVRYSKQVMEIE